MNAGQKAQGAFQGLQISGVGSAVNQLGGQTVNVHRLLQQIPQFDPANGLGGQCLHRILAGTDGNTAYQGLFQPAAKHSGTCGSAGTVHRPEQAAAGILIPQGLAQLQIPSGEAVDAHIPLRLVEVGSAEMAKIAMHSAVLQYVDQASHGQNGVGRRLGGDHAVLGNIRRPCSVRSRILRLHLGKHGAITVGKLVQEGLVHPRHEEEFAGGIGRRLGGQLAVGILPPNIGGKHLAGGKIRKHHAVSVGGGVHGTKEVVPLLVEHTGFKHRACGDHTGDPSLHQALGGGGVLQLFHNGNAEALGHQLRQVGVQGVVGHAAHRRALLQTAVSPRQYQLQGVGGRLGILKKQLVEVAQAHHHKTIGVLRFYFFVLLHQG